jgi:hypothetical protein
MLILTISILTNVYLYITYINFNIKWVYNKTEKKIKQNNVANIEDINLKQYLDGIK